jgi:periplasmic copper chaperone A
MVRARLQHAIAVTAVMFGLAGLAGAEPTASIGAITIHEACARASMGQTGTSAVYMTLEASGGQGDRLVAVASPDAARAELHTSIVEDGVAKMRPLAAIEIAPGEPTVLEPGGPHVMLMGLGKKLAEGDTLPLSLTFEQAGTIELQVPVKGMGGAMSHGDHQQPPN